MNIIRAAFSQDQRVLAAPLNMNTLLPVTKWTLKVGKARLVNSAGREVLFVGKHLGSGSFGSVFSALVSVKKSDGSDSVMPVAVKIGKADKEMIKAELAETGAYEHLSMDALCSPLVTCLYAVFVTKLDPDPASKKWNYGLVMELMDGDLIKLVRDIKSTTAEDKYVWLIYIALYMIYGLNYLHSNGWAHNDVKPENFLYKWDPASPLPTIKIADLGFACSTQINQTAQTARIRSIIDAYIQATGSTVQPITPNGINTICRRSTTPFFQLPKWDAYTPYDPTPSINENFENDRYEFVMSLKTLFFESKFDLNDVVKYADNQAERDAWGPVPASDPDEFYDRQDTLRTTDLPYKFLSMPLRDIGHEFSDTLSLLGSNQMTTEAGMVSIADIFDRAKRI